MKTSTHPFETNLDRHPSNYIPLSPVSFLTRAASAFAGKVAVIDGARRYHLCAAARSLRPARIRIGAAWGQAARYGGDHRIEHSGDDRGAFCRADARRRAQSAEYPSRCREYRFLAHAWKRQGLDRRCGLCTVGAAGAATGGSGDRRHRYRFPRTSQSAPLGKHAYEALLAAGDPGLQLAGRVPTNGSRSACSIPQAPPATQKASSTVIAAPIFRRSATASASD